MEPWGPSALTFFHVKNCLLRITRCFLLFKKSRVRFSKFPDMPFWVSLKSDSHLPKNVFLFARMIALQKWQKNAFYFILKALSVLKIFRFLSWHFGHAEKTTWFRNLWRQSLVNKELQHTYCSISHELKATRQWNLVN